jgi:nicotinamidase-related amidase
MKKGNGVIVYESLREIIEPDHSCLVVWDVQNGLVDRIFNKEEFMTNLKKFIGKLNSRMPIVYTLITPMHRNFASSLELLSDDEALRRR